MVMIKIYDPYKKSSVNSDILKENILLPQIPDSYVSFIT